MHRAAEWIKYRNGNLQLPPVLLCFLLLFPFSRLLLLLRGTRFSKL